MSRQHYRSTSFHSSTLELIDVMNAIIDDYVSQGYTLTVRQLYYQLVARGHIPNTERSYKRTTGIVNDARLAGLMDWDAIEDRTREFITRPHWSSGREILEGVAKQFYMDMWQGQPHRVFVIVEKEALAGVLSGVCRNLDMPLLAARGYPSSTVLREFVLSDVLPAIQSGQRVVFLHLGDHDPSGIDMSRDLIERLQMFAEGEDFDFERIALNMDQIEQQRPPPNPAKTTDSRFEAYLREHGDESWELDALSPAYLSRLVSDRAEGFIDAPMWSERQSEILNIREELVKTAKRFKM